MISRGYLRRRLPCDLQVNGGGPPGAAGGIPLDAPVRIQNQTVEGPAVHVQVQCRRVGRSQEIRSRRPSVARQSPRS